MKKILVIDANAPWVRSLLAAMKGHAEVFALNVHNAFTGNRPGIRRLFKWEIGEDGFLEKPILVPGWTKFPGLSAKLVRRAAERAIRRFGGFDAVIYTLPMYAAVANTLAGGTCQIYYAHDPFRFYDWDPARTVELERQMLAACDGSFAIALALVEDLKQITAKPVFYSPNAVSKAFIDRLAGNLNVPDDLRGMSRPIVGCVGQINRSYDWLMIGSLADATPEATFVFVGPIFAESAKIRAPMDSVMAKPNVKWLGKKPHGELPAYLKGFDVCLNPLAINEHNDRRSPLRLYDYLATDKPILSIAVKEAFTHGKLIETFKTAEEGTALLRRMFAGEIPVDQTARSAYIQRNTWEARAEQFLSHITEICRARGS